MAMSSPIADAIGMFRKDEYVPLKYSKELDQSILDAISQLSYDRKGYNQDISNIEQEVRGAQDIYKDITPEDVATLGRISQAASADPRDLFSFVASQFPGMAYDMLGKLNAGGLQAVDKLNMSRSGMGGRGNARSRYENILSANRMGQAAIPLFNTALSSIIPGVTALSNVGAQNARTAMDAVAQRGVVPLRGVGLSFLPMEARDQASKSQIGSIKGLGEANVANIFGIDKKTNWAGKLSDYGNKHFGQLTDLAKTAASMYFTGGLGGLGGMMGGGGGTGGAGGMFSQIFGMQKPTGGQQANNQSGGFSTPYIPVAPTQPGFGQGYGYGPNYGYNPQQAPDYYRGAFG